MKNFHYALTHASTHINKAHLSTAILNIWFNYKPLVLIIGALFIQQSCFVQQAYAADSLELNVPAIAVTGNPLGVGSDELVVPVSVINGRELSLRREGTLGETLNGIPGVTATQFGQIGRAHV